MNFGNVDVDPTFAARNLPQQVARCKEAIQDLTIQLDATRALLASPLAAEDEIVRLNTSARAEALERQVRIEAFYLAEYETRMELLNKVAKGE